MATCNVKLSDIFHKESTHWSNGKPRSNEFLEWSLKKAENEEDYDKCIEIRDELKRRNA